MNPFATGTSAGHAPRRSDGESTGSANALRIVGRIAKMRTEREDGAKKRTRGSDRGKRRKEESEREREDARGDRKVVRTARRRPRLVIYTESYLHLNVFIFNARPRNRLSALGGFVSAPHLLRPLTDLSRASVSLRFAFS